MNVNDKLHALRGQHWRESNNSNNNNKAIITPITKSFVPSLPRDLFDNPVDYAIQPIPSWSGPRPPRSWINIPTVSSPDYESLAWRANALSPLLQSLCPATVQNNRTPSLVHLCLQRTLASYSPRDLGYILPYLPHHLRHLLSRFCALYAPSHLSSDIEEMVSEVFIIGPKSMEPNAFRPHPTNLATESWDSTEEAEDSPYSIAILNATIPSFPALFLPITVTHLTLIHVTGPLPLHRILANIPQAIFIDLSYNDWLSSPEPCNRILDSVSWVVLTRLKILGLRSCPVNQSVHGKINEGRWIPITCIQDGDNAEQ